jgi:uncharacterized LabA/DUF88 family protein
MNNQAFIDAQNLRLGTTKDARPWKVDLVRFRVYLREKYGVDKAYYFFGSFDDSLSEMYEFIQAAGYILSFREHSKILSGQKKGNVDTDIVFAVMKKLYLKEPFDKVVLVSGDGDYKRLMEFLIGESRFEKILFPNKKFASSLYKALTAKYTAHLDTDDMRQKLGLREPLDADKKERGTYGN